MTPFRTFLLAFVLLIPSPAPAAPSARVDTVRIDKSAHTLTLLAGDEIVRTYRVAIGMGGAGPKRMEGDRVTPVGTYRVTGRFGGLFHQFLVLSYPNTDDRKRNAELRERGEIPKGIGPGHGIGIHGVGDASDRGEHKRTDWTHGCIALDDAEIDEFGRLVRDGTTVVITD